MEEKVRLWSVPPFNHPSILLSFGFVLVRLILSSRRSRVQQLSQKRRRQEVVRKNGKEKRNEAMKQRGGGGGGGGKKKGAGIFFFFFISIFCCPYTAGRVSLSLSLSIASFPFSPFGYRRRPWALYSFDSAPAQLGLAWLSSAGRCVSSMWANQPSGAYSMYLYTTTTTTTTAATAKRP